MNMIELIQNWKNLSQEEKENVILRLPTLLSGDGNINLQLQSAITSSVEELILFILRQTNPTQNQENDSYNQYVNSLRLILQSLPAGLPIKLWNNNIGDKGAKTFASALQSATNLPTGLYINLGCNKIGDDGTKAIAHVLRLNPGIYIQGLDFENYISSLNKRLFSLVQGSHTDLFQDEKRKELTNEVLDLLENHPESILNFIKWLIKKTTTAHFSALAEYKALATFVNDVLASEIIAPYHQTIIQLTQNTWLESLVTQTIVMPEIELAHDFNSKLFGLLENKLLTTREWASLQEQFQHRSIHEKNQFIENFWRDKLKSFNLKTDEGLEVFEHVLQKKNEYLDKKKQYEEKYGVIPKLARLADNNDNALTALAKTFLEKHGEAISQLFNHDEDSKICKMLCATFLSLNDDFTQENQHEAIANEVIQQFINLALTPLQTETTLLETTAMEKDLEILYATMLAKLYPDEFSFEPDETAIAQSAPRENSFFSLQTETHPNPTNSQGIASENTHVKLG